MNKLLVVFGLGMACLIGGSGETLAQVVSPLAPLGAAAAPVPQKTIWGFFGINKANHAACKDGLCRSQAGQLLNNGLGPASFLTGGVIPNGFCPSLPAVPPGADLAGPAGPAGAQSAAAAVAQDQATAPARIAAIEYLATVECHYWPEATAALIGRLRGDRVECVRFAAARALLTGCCCTAKTVEALANVLEERPSDKFPSENSERVKATAFLALQRCMACLVEDDKPPASPPEPLDREPLPRPLDLPDPVRPASATIPAAKGGASVDEVYAAYYERVVPSRSTAAILADARRVLGRVADARAANPPRTTGSLSVAESLARSIPPREPASPAARVESSLVRSAVEDRISAGRQGLIGLWKHSRLAGADPAP